ncbi:hypothetical protein GQ53DRAFT_752099 [Thozetella sp. PMI_491]|nr:hypothetical protein GQ53DRAFT_752099 [Thozetella sp. PMI_491]
MHLPALLASLASLASLTAPDAFAVGEVGHAIWWFLDWRCRKANRPNSPGLLGPFVNIRGGKLIDKVRGSRIRLAEELNRKWW